MERDVIELISDDGEKISLEIVDYFFYDGVEYAVLMDDVQDSEQIEGMDAYLMRIVTEGDEEFFETVNGEELEKVSDYYFNEYLYAEDNEELLDLDDLN